MLRKSAIADVPISITCSGGLSRSLPVKSAYSKKGRSPASGGMILSLPHHTARVSETGKIIQLRRGSAQSTLTGCWTYSGWSGRSDLSSTLAVWSARCSQMTCAQACRTAQSCTIRFQGAAFQGSCFGGLGGEAKVLADDPPARLWARVSGVGHMVSSLPPIHGGHAGWQHPPRV